MYIWVHIHQHYQLLLPSPVWGWWLWWRHSTWKEEKNIFQRVWVKIFPCLIRSIHINAVNTKGKMVKKLFNFFVQPTKLASQPVQLIWYTTLLLSNLSTGGLREGSTVFNLLSLKIVYRFFNLIILHLVTFLRLKISVPLS